MSSHGNFLSQFLSSLAAIAGSVTVATLSCIAIVSGLCLANTLAPVLLLLMSVPGSIFGAPYFEPQTFLAEAPIGVCWALLYLVLLGGSICLLTRYSFALDLFPKVWSLAAGLLLVPTLYAIVFLSAELILHIVLGTIMMCFPLAGLLVFLMFLTGEF